MFKSVKVRFSTNTCSVIFTYTPTIILKMTDKYDLTDYYIFATVRIDRSAEKEGEKITYILK